MRLVFLFTLVALAGRAAANDEALEVDSEFAPDPDTAISVARSLLDWGWAIAPLPDGMFSQEAVDAIPGEPLAPIESLPTGYRVVSITGENEPAFGSRPKSRNSALDLALHRFSFWAAAMPNFGYLALHAEGPSGKNLVAPHWLAGITSDWHPNTPKGHVDAGIWLRAEIALRTWDRAGERDTFTIQFVDPRTRNWVRAPQGYVLWFGGNMQEKPRAIFHRQPTLFDGMQQSSVCCDLLPQMGQRRVLDQAQLRKSRARLRARTR